VFIRGFDTWLNMQNFDCHGDWLIDYADGALPQQQLATADQHLSQCPACQRQLAALQISGARLNDYFTTLRSQTAVSRPLRSTSWNSVVLRAAAVAACLALLAMGYWLNRQARVDIRPVEIVQRDPTPREATERLPQTDHDDIAAEIARETQIARLRAAITILKDEPGMSERSAALQQYLSQAYQVDLDLPAM
jgi:hypothetical protein